MLLNNSLTSIHEKIVDSLINHIIFLYQGSENRYSGISKSIGCGRNHRNWWSSHRDSFSKRQYLAAYLSRFVYDASLCVIRGNDTFSLSLYTIPDLPVESQKKVAEMLRLDWN